MDFSGLNSARSGPSEEIKIKSDSLCTDMLLHISLFMLFCAEKALSLSAEEIEIVGIILTRWSMKSVFYECLVSRFCHRSKWDLSLKVFTTKNFMCLHSVCITSILHPAATRGFPNQSHMISISWFPKDYVRIALTFDLSWLPYLVNKCILNYIFVNKYEYFYRIFLIIH